MNQALLDKIEADNYRKNSETFAVGDSVRVHTKVVEGDKERIQVYAGVVIGCKGHGLNATFTVRRISYGEGVERVFPLHSPRIDKVEIERKGKVRRAKLTYLRKRIGKGATPPLLLPRGSRKLSCCPVPFPGLARRRATVSLS
jgi:large subunit ribosomal protein L19